MFSQVVHAEFGKRNSACEKHCTQENKKEEEEVAFYAWDSSPHLPVTPAQLMKSGIGRNTSANF